MMASSFEEEEALYLPVDFLYRESRYQDVADYMLSIEILEQSNEMIETYFNSLLNLRRQDDAMALVEDLINKKPEEYFGYLLLGNYYRFSFQFAESVPAYQKMVELEPTQEMYEILLYAMSQGNQKEDFKVLAEELFDQYKLSIGIVEDLFDIYIEEEAYEKAGQLYVDYYDEYEDIIRFLNNCYGMVLRGNTETAITLYRYFSEATDSMIPVGFLLSEEFTNRNEEQVQYLIEVVGALGTPEDVEYIKDKYEKNIDRDYTVYIDQYYDLAMEGLYYEALEPLKTFFRYFPMFNEIYARTLFNAYYDADLLFEAQRVFYDYEDKLAEEELVVYRLGETYILLEEYEKALGVLERFAEEEFEDINGVYAYKAYIYYAMGDYEEAQKYVDLYTPSDSFFDVLVEDLELMMQYTDPTQYTDVEIIENLFEGYYLYEVDDIEKILESEELTLNESARLFEDFAADDDMFTGVVSMEQNQQVDSDSVSYNKLKDNVHYVAIHSFTSVTQYEFIDTINPLLNKDESILIIDLRDNRGGDTKATLKIADYLLDEVCVYSMVYKDGAQDDFLSNESQIEFMDIYILVNKESASASEVLALSLMTHLPNVVVVGEQTYGKGVGQVVVNDFENGRQYYIVNHYLEVEGINYHGVGITPDVVLKDQEIDRYMTELLDVSGL
jgi:tetratricopeptide (TPR) repeat protein